MTSGKTTVSGIWRSAHYADEAFLQMPHCAKGVPGLIAREVAYAICVRHQPPSKRDALTAPVLY
jgi:hypothetical protein